MTVRSFLLSFFLAKIAVWFNDFIFYFSSVFTVFILIRLVDDWYCCSCLILFFRSPIIWRPIYPVNQIEWKMTDIIPKTMALHIGRCAICPFATKKIELLSSTELLSNWEKKNTVNRFEKPKVKSIFEAWFNWNYRNKCCTFMGYRRHGSCYI